MARMRSRSPPVAFLGPAGPAAAAHQPEPAWWSTRRAGWPGTEPAAAQGQPTSAGSLRPAVRAGPVRQGPRAGPPTDSRPPRSTASRPPEVRLAAGTPRAGRPRRPTPRATGRRDAAEGWQHDTAIYARALLPPTPERRRRAASGAAGSGCCWPLAAITGLLAGGIGGYVGVAAGRRFRHRPTARRRPSFPVDAVPLRAPRARSPRSPRGSAPRWSSISVETNQGAGTGSGFVIRDDGYILTNNHVVAEAADGGTITVRMSDGKSYQRTHRRPGRRLRPRRDQGRRHRPADRRRWATPTAWSSATWPSPSARRSGWRAP